MNTQPILKAADALAASVAASESKRFHEDIDRLTEVLRARSSTVDIYKAERDALQVENAVLREALQAADALISIARNYFPKSIRNSDTFTLNVTAAAIGKARAALLKARDGE